MTHLHLDKQKAPRLANTAAAQQYTMRFKQ
jgi:hypothetical protein